MSERGGRADPHVVVERDVLVRYLDVWTAGALRSHRGATYVSSADSGFVADAFGVFGEFVDRLAGHHLEVVLVGAAPAAAEPPAGLPVRVVTDPAGLVVNGPALAHLDGRTEVDPWRLIVSLARGKGREVILTLPATQDDYRERLREVGLACVVAVELVADDGRAHLLVFATKESRHLTTFKNELWAVDEFAGIRYRDPHDPEHTLVDISLTPQLLPLRRMLLTELARGSRTVADLQRHTLLETIYRPADAIGALTSAAAAGDITREPEKGRLTSRTIVTCHPG